MISELQSCQTESAISMLALVQLLVDKGVIDGGELAEYRQKAVHAVDQIQSEYQSRDALNEDDSTALQIIARAFTQG